MSGPFKVEGIDYTPDGITALREAVIELRHEAMVQSAFGAVTVLTHAVALLAYLIELIELVEVGAHDCRESAPIAVASAGEVA